MKTAGLFTLAFAAMTAMVSANASGLSVEITERDGKVSVREVVSQDSDQVITCLKRGANSFIARGFASWSWARAPMQQLRASMGGMHCRCR